MGSLTWLLRLFRTVQLVFCNSIRNLMENINYTCRLFLYGTLWRETVTTGQKVTAGQTVSAGQTVTAGQTVSAGQTVTAGQKVTAGQTVSAGQTVTAAQTVIAGHTVTAGQTVPPGQMVSAGQTYQNKCNPSVLKLSIGSSTSPENWQNLEDEFFGIRKHLHNELFSRFLDFLQEKYAIGIFEIYLLLAVIRFQCTRIRTKINSKIITLWKLFSPSEIYGSSIGSVRKI